MKRALSLILILVCLLTSCGKPTAGNEEERSTEDEVTTTPDEETTDEITETEEETTAEVTTESVTTEAEETKEHGVDLITLSMFNPLNSGNVLLIGPGPLLSNYTDLSKYNGTVVSPKENQLLVDNYEVIKDLFETHAIKLIATETSFYGEYLKLEDYYKKEVFDEYFFFVRYRREGDSNGCVVKYTVADFDFASNTLKLDYARLNDEYVFPASSHCIDFYPIPKSVITDENGNMANLGNISIELKFYASIPWYEWED